MSRRGDRFQETFYALAGALNSSLDSREVLATIARGTAEALGAKACSLMLLSPDGRELYHRSAYGLSDSYVRKGPLSVDLSMAEALRGRAVAVLDAAGDPRIQYRAQAQQEGIASILSVPVRLRGEVVGVLRVYTAEPREFAAEEVRFVEAVADLGAIALENARRYEEARSSYEGVRQDLLEWYATWGLERSADALAGASQEE